MPSGYSATPLAKKLSLKHGMRVCWDGIPASVRAEIEREGLELELSCDPPIEAAHIFVTRRGSLERKLRLLLPLLAPNGFVWVSWPKKAARKTTDITEDTIRDVALPMGLVDVKVCAVDDSWSGLKLVIRKELRRTA